MFSGSTQRELRPLLVPFLSRTLPSPSPFLSSHTTTRTPFHPTPSHPLPSPPIPSHPITTATIGHLLSLAGRKSQYNLGEEGGKGSASSAIQRRSSQLCFLSRCQIQFACAYAVNFLFVRTSATSPGSCTLFFFTCKLHACVSCSISCPLLLFSRRLALLAVAYRWPRGSIVQLEARYWLPMYLSVIAPSRFGDFAVLSADLAVCL